MIIRCNRMFMFCKDRGIDFNVCFLQAIRESNVWAALLGFPL